MASTKVRLGNCKENTQFTKKKEELGVSVFLVIHALFFLFFFFGLFITIGGVVSELSR